MPDTVVTNPDAVKLSAYDVNQIRALESSIVEGIQRNGSDSWETRNALTQAFQLGFTAVGRGEAEGQAHPPKPSFMTEEAIADENAAFENGTKVRWNSQAKGISSIKIGVIVERLYPGEQPNRERFPGLYKTGIGGPRNHISYVVEVKKLNSAAQPKYYWPRTPALKIVK